MVDEIVIVDATHEHVLRWLQDLVVLASDEQRKNPLRPQLGRLIAARLDPYQLPIYLRSRQKRVFGIYSGARAGASPFVALLVRVSVEELYPRTLRLELECDPAFPITQGEVRWHLLQRFPNHETGGAPGAPLPTGPNDSALLRPPGHRSRPDEAAALPGATRNGAPVLSCNEWLEEQLAQRADEEQRRALYRPWLERYRALRGFYPADPRRSFRAAVTGCLRRLEAQDKLRARARRSGDRVTG